MQGVAVGMIGGFIAIGLVAGIAKAVTDIKFSFGTNGAGNTVIYPQISAILGVPMGILPSPVTVATTTAGTLATSSVKTYTFSNVASGALATSSVPLTYYFEVGATDVNGGASLPSSEVSANVSSSATSNEIIASWGSTPGAKFYDVYIGTSTGAESLLATTTALTFTLSTTTVSSTTGISLATPPTVNFAYVDTFNPNGKSYIGGDLQVVHLNGNNNATVSTSTGAGTGATTTVAYATDLSGSFTLNTGSASIGTSTPLITITYGEAYAKAPACDLFPESSNAQKYNTSSTMPFMIPGTTSTAVEAATVALPTSTSFVYGWICSN